MNVTLQIRAVKLIVLVPHIVNLPIVGNLFCTMLHDILQLRFCLNMIDFTKENW